MMQVARWPSGYWHCRYAIESRKTQVHTVIGLPPMFLRRYPAPQWGRQPHSASYVRIRRDCCEVRWKNDCGGGIAVISVCFGRSY